MNQYTQSTINMNNVKEIKVPLKFWFNNSFSQDKEKEKKVEKIMNNVNLLYHDFQTTTMTYEELIELRDKLIDMEDKIIQVYAITIFPKPKKLKLFIDPVNKAIKKFIPNWYNTSKVLMSENDEVNGYKLMDTSKMDGLWFAYDWFLKLEQLYNEPNVMTEDEFYKKYNEDACTEWSKMDEHGEYFSGFWKYPEGSYEKENAYELTREANGKALFNLPYSHSLIFQTIQTGCGNLQESVRFSNFMCEYIKRTIELKLNDKRKSKLNDFIHGHHIKKNKLNSD